MKNKNLKQNISWNKKIAQKIAKKESIEMTRDHWEIIYTIRTFYLKFNLTPSIRMLIKLLEKTQLKKITSCYLFKLFPLGPIKQASKIAGIPEPSHCI
ncbi:MAG: TusE/DsrC/DsvC family sulfur relay protein [Buchnera aphidicola (Meitanaphis elongallis)]